MKSIFVILVTYRRFDHFKQTVESLLPTLPPKSKVAIIYNREGRSADDFQYEGYFRKLTAEHDYIEVLDTGSNDGWGSSVNEGLHLYSGWREYEYVLESNNDVTYEADWCSRAQTLMEKYPKLGVLGLWSHKNHGIKFEHEGLVVKDDMPAVAWLMRSKDLDKFLPFPEYGSTNKRGGNSEDSHFTAKVQEQGFWVGGSVPDLAHHMDGYDTPDLGKVNSAYL